MWTDLSRPMAHNSFDLAGCSERYLCPARPPVDDDATQVTITLVAMTQLTVATNFFDIIKVKKSLNGWGAATNRKLTVFNFIFFCLFGTAHNQIFLT